MTDREEELRDEHRWFADETRVRLFETAAEVLGDPGVPRRIGESAIDLNVGQAIKLSLRALGSPRMMYSNLGRANAKFNRVHKMDVLEIGANHARIRNVPCQGADYSSVDCEYNIGLFSCAPLLFGDAPARVRHPICMDRGDSECIYEVEWSSSDRIAGIAGLNGVSLGALGATALFLPALLLPAIGLTIAMATFTAVRIGWSLRRRWRLLQSQVVEQNDVADLLMTSMQDLVSALQLDEVLSKITANARSAVGGAEFALLVCEDDVLRCRSSSDLPATVIERLEGWAGSQEEMMREATVVDDLTTIPGLGSLTLDGSSPMGSLCAAPLIFREQSIGILVALASSESAFLPRDVKLLSSYAAQAATALTNARLYAAQLELAIQDPLTGLFNHRHFHETLERELERCRRHGGELGIALFDLDGFKQVNDTGGHAEGDEVLRQVAGLLESSGRRGDLAFRIGGDEFALVLPGTGLSAARVIADRARNALATADERTSISYGIASWPGAGPTKDAVLAAADSSLYAMKRRAVPERVAAPREVGLVGKHQHLACTSRLAVKLAPLLDEDEIGRTAVAELKGSFAFDRVMIHRLENGREPTSDGIVGRAARGGEAVLVNGAAGSQLATPIRVDGKRWAVLEVAVAEDDGFGYVDVLFAETIAAAVGAAIHRGQLYSELEGTFMRTIAVLSDALETKDSYTATHAREVAEFAEVVGQSFGMSAEEQRTLSYGALLHDIGKIAIRSEILHKPGPLTDAEYEEMKEHTVVGAEMLERIPYFAEVHPLVRSSHERWDGAGYPDGTSGSDIPLGARIIAACDAYHAMTTDRPYRKAMDPSEAVAELRRNSGTQFDSAVIDVLIALLDHDSGDLLTEDASAIQPVPG